MTDTPPQPKLRRWRWLVVALLFVSFAGWLCWPQGDGRFAGTWSIVRADGQQVGILSLARVGLNSVRQTPPGSPPLKRQYFLRWEVQDGILLFGNQPSDFDSLYGRLIRTAAQVPGATFFSGVDRLVVEDVTDDRILLRRIESDSKVEGARITLNRISE
jgi:hypothetical protein